MKRLDRALVDRGLACSRSRAQDLVKEGGVLLNQEICRRPSRLVDDADELTVEHALGAYVGRGALKLESGLAHFPLSLAGVVAVDIGAGTGGFTQILLQKGAQKVYAVDGGRGQLAASLAYHPQVENWQGVNARFALPLPHPVDLVVADVSFISLRLILPQAWAALKQRGQALVLFKPQFEQTKRTWKNLKGKAARPLLQEFASWCQQQGWAVYGHAPCSLVGREGSEEFWFHLQRPS